MLLGHRSIVGWEPRKKCVLPSHQNDQFQNVLQFLVDDVDVHHIPAETITTMKSTRNRRQASLQSHGFGRRTKQPSPAANPGWDANYWKSPWFAGSICGEHMDIKINVGKLTGNERCLNWIIFAVFLRMFRSFNSARLTTRVLPWFKPNYWCIWIRYIFLSNIWCY